MRTGVLVVLIACLAAPYLLPNYPLFVLSLAIVNIIAVLGREPGDGVRGADLPRPCRICGNRRVHDGAARHQLWTCRSGSHSRSERSWPPPSAMRSGLPALRLGPLYVSMVTFGFGLIVVIILQNWYELANGPNGLVVPAPTLFGYELDPRDIPLADRDRCRRFCFCSPATSFIRDPVARSSRSGERTCRTRRRDQSRALQDRRFCDRRLLCRHVRRAVRGLGTVRQSRCLRFSRLHSLRHDGHPGRHRHACPEPPSAA